jgi:hypothetical protein
LKIKVGESDKSEFQTLLKSGKRGKAKPGKFRLESEPNTLNGIEFRGIGGQKEQDGLRGKAEVFGMMNFGIVEEDNVKGVGMVSGKSIEKGLKRSGIELERGFKIGFARGGGDDTKEIKCLKAMLA